MNRITRFITRHVFLAILLVLVALAFLFTAARLFTPTLLAGYTDQIAEIATERLGQPVTIGSLSARWHGVGPVLVLRDVTLWHSDRSTPAVKLDEIEVDFGAADMLTSGYLAPGRITVRGTHLTVVRQRDGTLSPRGIARGEGDVSALLLGPTRARLLDARVEWVDELRQRPPVVLEAANILVRNDGERHQLDADFSLEGRRITLRADLTAAKPGRLGDWRGKIYLRTEGLPLPPLLAGNIPTDYDLRSGAGDIELWGVWSAGRVQSLTGRGDVRDLRLAGTGGAVFDVETISGRFEWRRDSNGWRLDADELAFRRSGRSWPTSRLSIEARSANSTTASWRLRTDHIDLADLFAAAAIRPAPHGLLADLLAARPSGEIHDLDLWFRPATWPVFAVSGGIHNFSMAAHGRLPMLDNFSASVHATNNGGRLVLTTRDAAIHPAHLFRWPIPVARLTGELDWQRRTGGWQLLATGIEAVNAHISTRTRMRLDLADAGGPFLDLQTDFRDGVATYAPNYYPTAIMSPKLVNWLDRSIVDGRVPSGSFILRGPLRDFPFHRSHSGHFEVLFGVEDVFLDYREGWPPLEDLVAYVRFHNNSLQIFNASAQLYDNRLSPLEAHIETLKPLALLHVRGEARGPLKDVIRLLRETPLRNNYGPLAEETVAGGNSRLELGFALPLRKGTGEFSLDGTLVFEHSSLKNEILGLDLSAIEGPLAIHREGVSAKQIKASLAGNRIAASVTPTRTGTRIHASGRLDTRSIKKAYPGLAPVPMDGASKWNLAVSVPPPTRLNSTGVVIEAASQLDGTRIDLPLGLGKPAQGRRPFEARVALARGNIGDLELTLGDLHLTGQPGPEGWEAYLDSPAAVGRIVLPPPGPQQQPVQAEFDRLSVTIDPTVLQADSAVARGEADPAKVPEMDLAAREVFINGNPYGELTAKTRRTAMGVRMQEMRLRSSDGELSLNGDWTSTESQQRTALNLKLHTTDLGRILRDLAISQAVAAGEGRIEAEAEWQGSPMDIRRETLSGRVRFRADDGRFDEAEPGVGRLFGLLNVGALQRRLRLDFSDLFQQGFAFEKIEGEFTINDGVARTDDTRITGPSGDIRIEGLTDLVSTQMNQNIHVVPAISGAVALAGGIAGGPLVGAALLAAGKGIDKLATVHYRMTGPWDDPQVEQAASPPADAPDSPGTGLPEIH